MKNILTLIKNKIRRAWQWLAGETIMIWHWIKNLCFVYLTSKSEFRIFEGYGHWWFARQYADRRTEISRINKYCGGKRHYVIPAGDYALAVLNSSELQLFKAKGIVSKNMTIQKVLETAYYVSDETNRNKKRA